MACWRNIKSYPKY